MKWKKIVMFTFIAAAALIGVSLLLSGMPFWPSAVVTDEVSSQKTPAATLDSSRSGQTSEDGSTTENSESLTTDTGTSAVTTTSLTPNDTTADMTSEQSATVDPNPSRGTTDETTKATIQTTTVTETSAKNTSSESISTTANSEVKLTFHVSTNGSNSNMGTAESPFLTIQHAIETVPSGSTILVAAGEYRERLVIRERNRLDIKNKPGDRPVLSGVNKPGDRPVLSGVDFSDGYLVDVDDSQRIVISGFEVRDFQGPDLEGIIIRRGSSGISISNCVFHDIGTTDADGNAHVILAIGKGNTPLTNINITNNEIYRCSTGWSEVITMESNVDGFAITDNTIHDVTNIAIDATGFYDNDVTNVSLNQARNGLIANNLVYDVASPNATCAGIYVDGGREIGRASCRERV